MCIGIPMRIASIDGVAALFAESDDDGETIIDLSLVPDCQPGDWVLTFLGSARRRLETGEAILIRNALGAVAAAMRGERSDLAFADLTGAEPSLPPHLEAARAAGLSEA
jgi:hydrogenase expression/formation protein HypC